MKRLGYFEKLSLAARWLLPNDEAENMVEDYKDILYEVSGPEEALERFGPFWKPVMELADRKKIRRWHIAFAYMLFCTVFPPLYCILNGWFFDAEFCFNILVTGLILWDYWEVLLAGKYSKRILLLLGAAGSVLIVLFGMVMPAHIIAILNLPYSLIPYEPQTFAIGAIISLLYFGFKKMKNRKFSKPLLFGICLMFLAVAGIYGFVYYSFYISIDLLAYHERFFMVCFGLLLAFFFFGAIAGIFLAKLYDRRWRAVFILALLGTLICMVLVNLASRHYFEPNGSVKNIFSVFYNRNYPDYIFSNQWGSNINVIDEIFISYSWYTAIGGGLALIGLF